MIEVNGLVKKFGKTTALDRMTFRIGDASVFGLVGSNGAGKSTFLRTAAGVYRPDAGSILLDGEAPFENSRVKGKICFISDYPYFLPQSNLAEMGRFLSRLYPHWDWKRYAELNKLFPLGEKKRISAMSKGMQRQAALILAFSARPQYLLLDEIFDGLDPVIRQLLKRLLAEDVAARGMTVVIASHNLRELEDLCDHIGLFHKGGVLLEKDLDELRLGVCRVQAVFQQIPEKAAFAPLDILKWETHGSMLHLVVRNGREETLARLNAMGATFAEALPLTLEEVFLSEMEAAGYDIENILSETVQ
jgi:ABC-2 type transport system ATP-binding protein